MGKRILKCEHSLDGPKSTFKRKMIKNHSGEEVLFGFVCMVCGFLVLNTKEGEN